MLQVTENILLEMVQAIAGEIKPVAVYLFGSYARNEGRPDSDVDFLVVVDAPFQTPMARLETLQQIRKAISGYRISKDILVYSQNEVEKWKSSLNHIIARSIREGKLLYARS